jgi:hypothetical protein
MLDLLLIALVVGSFVVADLVVRGCGRVVDRGLEGRPEDKL